eukprot:gene25657-46746_t
MYTGAIPLAYSAVSEAMAKAKSTDPVKVARALEDLTLESVVGPVRMRGEDHQLLLPQVVNTIAPVDGKAVKVGWEGTNYGFRTDAAYTGNELAQGTDWGDALAAGRPCSASLTSAAPISPAERIAAAGDANATNMVGHSLTRPTRTAPMPDFRSDTVTQPTPAMREAMFKAPLGDDVFADDPSVNALQDHAAELLGFEAALFAPSGTQTNLIALWGHCQRGDEAIVGQSWHTYRWEAGGMAVLGSIQPQPVETQPDGTLRVADIA